MSEAVPVAGHHLFADHVDGQAEGRGHVEGSGLGQHLHPGQRAEVGVQQRPDRSLNLQTHSHITMRHNFQISDVYCFIHAA